MEEWQKELRSTNDVETLVKANTELKVCINAEIFNIRMKNI